MTNTREPLLDYLNSFSPEENCHTIKENDTLNLSDDKLDYNKDVFLKTFSIDTFNNLKRKIE